MGLVVLQSNIGKLSLGVLDSIPVDLSEPTAQSFDKKDINF